MSSVQPKRRLLLIAGAVAIVAMGAITAGCGGGNKGPSGTTTTTTTTTSSATPSTPTSTVEKNINPTGGNLFTPNPIPVLPAPSQNPHGIGSPVHTG